MKEEQLVEEEIPIDPVVERLLNSLGVPEDCRPEVADRLIKTDKAFIHRYIDNTSGSTHGYKLKAVEMYKIERSGCKVNFRYNLENRRLLWHGTQSSNVASILRSGFNMAKASKSGMFGPGIYFADCITKAAGYTRSGKYGYLFLCEVALGKLKTLTSANPQHTSEHLQGADSVLGVGRYGLLEETAQFCYEVLICPGTLHDFGETQSLQYNEYIVYSTDQIQMRYLVKVEFLYNQ